MTHIYAEVINGRKRKAAESISIKKKGIVKFFNYKRELILLWIFYLS